MKIIFTADRSIESWLIRFFTRSKFSHCAIVDCFSNTIIDSDFSKGGVTEYEFKNVILRSTLYEEFDLPCAPNTIIELVRTQIGKPYDILAVILLPFRRSWEDDTKWFCSELIAWAFKEVGCNLLHKKHYRVTPEDLYLALKEYKLKNC